MNFNGKIEMARIMIRTALNDHGKDNCAVACSFGKDSEVVLHLCLQEYPNIKVVFSNTGIEFADTLEFKDQLVKDWHLNFYEAKPKIRFGQIVRKYGLPKARMTASKTHASSRTPKCCEYLKERPGREKYAELGVKCIFTGITAEESRMRFMLSCRMGKYYYVQGEQIHKCHPIMDWTEEEVWQYLNMNGLPHNAHYDKFPGHRVGCAPCTAYLHWDERMPAESPKWYRFVQKHRGQKLIEEY